MTITKENDLNHDIRRTLILGRYMQYWGVPEFRIVSSKESHVVEVYSFPQWGSKVHRVATVGVSGDRSEGLKPATYEIMMTLPADLGGATFAETASFMMDVAVYSYREDVSFQVGTIIPETPLMPQSWNPRATLIDTPRGEPEELGCTMVGGQHIELFWLIPIYKNEYDLIKSKGLDAFDQAEQLSEISLVDMKRESFISP